MSAWSRAAAFSAAALTLAALAPGARAQDPVRVTADSVVFERLQNIRFREDSFDDDLGDEVLPVADEIAFSRAMALYRASRWEDAMEALDLLWRRYPASPRVASAAAAAYVRAGRAEDALKLLDMAEKAARESRARTGTAPSTPSVVTPTDPLAAARAHALLALGRRKEAIPYMVDVAADGRGEARDLRSQVLEWAETVDVGPQVVAAAAKRADQTPKDAKRVLLAAEIEVRAGKTQTALARLARLEGSAPRGTWARVVAERLSVDAQGATLSAPIWLELARGPYDPALRADALRRLLAMVTPGSFLVGSGKAAVAPVGASDLEAAWRSLPAGEERARIGLDLLRYLRARGERSLADRVANELSKSEAPESLAGPVDVEAGLLALGQGHLEEAGKRLERARTQTVDDVARERAEFAQAEVLFYAGQFDSAAVAFDAFASAHPLSPLTNDALERAFLLQPDADQPAGRAPGLASLAKGLYAEARRQWEEAATFAHRADEESRVSTRAAEPPPRAASDSAERESMGALNPVRANALLLLSRVEEARGAVDQARLAALAVADSLPGDRLAPAARKRVGDLDLASGHREAALAQYEEMLARYPRSWLASEVRRRVTDLRAELRAGRTP